VNAEALAKKPDDGGRTDKDVFKAVLIYRDFTAGLRARQFCETLTRTLDIRLEEQMWNFDVLGIREIRNQAASAARKADIVVLSLSDHTELPGTIRAWLDMWLWLLDKKKPAFVGLFYPSATQKTASIRAYLCSIARQGGIAFFPHEMSASVRQKSVSAVMGKQRSLGKSRN
jgi:hypothetical protein